MFQKPEAAEIVRVQPVQGEIEGDHWRVLALEELDRVVFIRCGEDSYSGSIDQRICLRMFSSSSTIKIFGFTDSLPILRRSDSWELQLDRGASVDLAVDPDMAAVDFNDRTSMTHPDAHAALFGGLKRTKDILQLLGRDAAACVANRRDDFTRIGRANGNVDSPLAFGQALDGIQQDVGKNFLQ